jgi:chemotaxis receptor (MCP) glutamine deamidase CheD
MPSYKSSEPTSRPDFVEAGDYTVEVINATETVSKKGSDMIELHLKVLPDGAVFFDHLVFVKNAFWKIDAFRASIGENVLPDEDVDIHADDFIGKQGRAHLSVEEYEGRKRNKIAAWLVPTIPKANSTPPTASKKDDDDDLPF